MKFVCFYRLRGPETSDLPTPREIEAMGKLIQEMSQPGVFEHWMFNFAQENL